MVNLGPLKRIKPTSNALLPGEAVAVDTERHALWLYNVEGFYIVPHLVTALL
jgi:hypothetical protein